MNRSKRRPKQAIETPKLIAIFEIVNLISLVSGAMVIILKLDSGGFNMAAQYFSDESEYWKMLFSNFPVFLNKWGHFS